MSELLTLIVLGAIYLAIFFCLSEGIFITMRAGKTEFFDILYFGLGMICFGLLWVFELTGWRVAQESVKVFGLLLFLLFCKKCFYQDKLTVVFKFIIIYHILIIFINPILSFNYSKFEVIINLLFGLGFIIVFYLMHKAAQDYYKKAKLLNIEPFLKKRYQFISVASIFFIITGLSIIIGHILRVSVSELIYLIFELSTIFSSLIASGILFFAFLVPKRVRMRINRDFKPESGFNYENVDEQDILDKLSLN